MREAGIFFNLVLFMLYDIIVKSIRHKLKIQIVAGNRRFRQVFLAVILALLGALIFYFLTYPRRVYFGNELILGNRREIEAVIGNKIDSYNNSNIIIAFADGKIEANFGDLGVGINKEATLSNFTRSGGVWGEIFAVPVQIFNPKKVEPVLAVDLQKFAKFWQSEIGKHEKEAVSATISFGGRDAQIMGAREGQAVDRADLIFKIKTAATSLSHGPIEAVAIRDEPRIKEAQAQEALEKVKTLNKQKIVLTFGYDSWTIANEKLIDILKFYENGQTEGFAAAVGFGDEMVIIKSIKLKDSAEAKLDVGLSGEKIAIFIDNIAGSIDRPKIDAAARFEGGRIVEFVSARDGQELDRQLTKKLILEKISIDNASAEKDIKIALPVVVTKAKIENEEINSLGIKELIGRGVSYFGGSIPNRIHNLSLGAKRINGVLVKPQETFSFNGAVGGVSEASGYKKAYVISAGRTILDDGGGICQVSTTVFRAVLAAGLPIISRTAHAYRVGYYEQRGFKPGLDATVWSPAVDFVFKNDTDHYILVQTVVDPANAKLQVDIYGTNDGRKVEVSDPVILSQTPALPDKYQDDPTLPRGVVKQVDFAAAGAKVEFGRKVYKGEALMIDEKFVSNYRPWQAIFLVGTGG